MITRGRNASLEVDGMRIQLYPVSDAFDNLARADAHEDRQFADLLREVRQRARQGWRSVSVNMNPPYASSGTCDYFAERFRRLGYRVAVQPANMGWPASLIIEWGKA